MAGENYNIDANLRLNAGQATSALSTFSSRLQGLGRSISGSNSGIMGMVGSLAAFGAAYVSVNTLIGGFSRLTQSAVAYQVSMEGLEIQTSAVMSAVDHIGFEQARGAAHDLFQQYRSDAIASVATTEDLVMINNALMGPLRGAGESMQTVRDMTNMTVTASTALGVDLAQASRDMQLMVNGSAGMHVRLYQMLHATGAIAENAQAFNQLSSTERIARLQSALGRFSGAAEAYGHSFAGATSTFQDIVDNLTSTFFGPAFDRLRTFLISVNDRLISNRVAIERVLRSAGQFFADRVQRVFDMMLEGMDYIGAHWDEIVQKGHDFVDRVHEVIPMLIHAAQVWGALSLARPLIGGAVSGAGSLLGMMGGGAAAAAVTTPALSAFETALAGATPALAAMGGTAGAPLAAGEIGAVEDMFAAAALRAATAAPLMGGVGLGAATVAPVAATAMETFFAALVPFLPIVSAIAAAFAALVAVGTVVYDYFDEFSAMFDEFRPVLEGTGADLMAIASDLWTILHPAFSLLGGIITLTVVPAVMFLVGVFHTVVHVVRRLMDMLAGLARVFDTAVIQPMVSGWISFATWLGGFFGDLFNESGPAGVIRREWGALMADMSDGLTELRDQYEGRTAHTGGGGQGGIYADLQSFTGQHRTHPAIDMRGSHISIRQEFREADPDRVLMQITDDLHRQAISRVTSGLSGALTRS